MEDAYVYRTTVDIKRVEELMVQRTNKSPKLSTYLKFKQSFRREEFINMFMPRRQRSLLAQFRAGTLPVHNETDRWAGIQADERVCNICRNGNIEHEVHFLLICAEYESCY